MSMRLGAAGERLIKSFEHLELVVYPDIRGIPTGGWGHTGFYGTDNEFRAYNFGLAPVTLADGSIPLHYGQILSTALAEKWFDDDTDDSVRIVNQLTNFVPLTQNQFDALVSFTFNAGIHAFAHSTLLQKLRAGLFSEVPHELLKWDHVGPTEVEGLERRRRAEAALFVDKGIL